MQIIERSVRRQALAEWSPLERRHTFRPNAFNASPPPAASSQQPAADEGSYCACLALFGVAIILCVLVNAPCVLSGLLFRRYSRHVCCGMMRSLNRHTNVPIHALQAAKG